MTVLEMHNAVYLGLDKSSSFQVAAFEPEDVDYWLNEAQEDIIKLKMFGNNPRGESYGEGVKRIEDLATLVSCTDKLDYDAVTGPLKNHTYHSNVGTLSISSNIDDYLYYIGSNVGIKYPADTGTEKQQETILVNESVISKLIATQYNKPALRDCYTYLKKGEVNIIYDAYAGLESIYVTYLKKPGILVRDNAVAGEVTTCILPEHVHSELVALTVNLMLECIFN